MVSTALRRRPLLCALLLALAALLPPRLALCVGTGGHHELELRRAACCETSGHLGDATGRRPDTCPPDCTDLLVDGDGALHSPSRSPDLLDRHTAVVSAIPTVPGAFARPRGAYRVAAGRACVHPRPPRDARTTVHRR
jgi:hypothetical protein